MKIKEQIENHALLFFLTAIIGGFLISNYNKRREVQIEMYYYHTLLLIVKNTRGECYNNELVNILNQGLLDITSLFNGSKNNSVVKYMVTPNN